MVEKYKVKNGCEHAPSKPTIFYETEVVSKSADDFALFAREDIKKNAVFAKDGGLIVSADCDGQNSKKGYGVFIENGLILVPSNYEEMDNLCYINHSCDANLMRIGGLIYVASRDICVGEEITIDYAPLVAGADYLWSMQCNCNHKNCRNVITSEDWKDSELSKKLWKEWLPHVQKWILNAEK